VAKGWGWGFEVFGEVRNHQISSNMVDLSNKWIEMMEKDHLDQQFFVGSIQHFVGL
jgi:hypothetical protein